MTSAKANGWVVSVASYPVADWAFMAATPIGATPNSPRRLVGRALGHREVDEIPIRHAQRAAHVSSGDGEGQNHDQHLSSSKGSLFPPTTGFDIFCGALDPKFARSNYIRSHRNRDVLARGAIPCEAEPGEPDQHHCPGRGLRNRASDGEVETKSA